MKKLIIISAMLLSYLTIQAQDTIITTKGEIIPCKITIITPDEVSYNDGKGDYTIPQDLIFDKKVNSHPQILATPVLKYDEIGLAGEDLRSASDIYYSGVVVMVLGGLLSGMGVLLSAENPEENTGKIMMYTGIGVGGVGLIVNISAFGKVASAGNHLRKYKP